MPWDQLSVYGAKDARDVPKLVRRVGQLRGSRRVRSEAFAALEQRLAHEGGLSPATVHVIPRLFAILRERPGRSWQRLRMLELLARFARPDPAADPEIARACVHAVEAGAPSLRHMSEDPSERVRGAARQLLDLFGDSAARGGGA